jgi:ribosomal protein S27AE
MQSQEFHLTQDHIDLLEQANIRWSDVEYGAPGIDEKRPFGNSGSAYIEREICEYLDLEPVATDHEGRDVYDDDEKHEAIDTYNELDTALRIVLSHQTFTPGVFVKENLYLDDWERQVVERGDDCPSCGNEVSLSVAGAHGEWRCDECGVMQDI